MSTNKASGGNKQPHKLRVVKKLAKVELTAAQVKTTTAVRLALKVNGFTPIPNRDKRTMRKGWNAYTSDETEIRSWLHPRASVTMHPATGLLVCDGLATIDLDIPEQGLADKIKAMIARVAPHLFGEAGALERGRDDNSPKTMLFCRRAGDPFTIRSKRWSVDGTGAGATFVIEIFASERNKDGLARRQVGAFGPHTVDDDTGKVKINYRWNGEGPDEVPLDQLPLLTREQALEIAREADRILAEAGMKEVEDHPGGLIEPKDVYDLDNNLRFDGEDFADVSLDELIELYWEYEQVGEELRCSGSFVDENAKRNDRCQVGWSGTRESGHITVHDHATEVTHRPVEEEPVTPEDADILFGEIATLIDTGDGGGGGGDDGGGGGGGDAAGGGPSFQDRWNAAIGAVCAEWSYSEHVFALTLARLYEGKICYSPKEKQWLLFKSPRWVETSGAVVTTKLIGDFCRAIPLARTPKDMKVRRTLDSLRHQTAVETKLRALMEHAGGFDLDPYVVCGPTTAIDLKTGRARPGRPEDWLRHSLYCDPTDTAQCPNWIKFLAEVTLRDADLQRLLQQLMGLSLCGDPTHQKLSYFHGTGRNGKNTFIDLMKKIAGAYGHTANAEVFMDSKFDRHSQEIWMLKGKRMVIASEVKKGAAWDENRIKRLTGDEDITARGMRMNDETFPRTWTITIIGNNEPDVKDVDVAIMSRLIMVPFDYRVPDDQIDKELPKKLLAEAPGILRWALDGFLDVRANGLVQPARVKAKTKDYFASQDAKQAFIDEHIEVDDDPNGKGIDNTTLYRRWKGFAEMHNARPGGINGMGWIAEMTKAVKDKTKKGVVWSGIKFANVNYNGIFGDN